MGPLLVIAVLFLGCVLLSVALVVAWRLHRPVVEEVAWNAFPNAELERQSNLATTLAEGGFSFSGFQRESRGTGTPVWQSLFRFAEGAVWAVVEALPDEAPRIVLHTFFNDGSTLTTSSGPFLEYNTSAEWVVREGTWNTFDEQAQAHLDAALSSDSKPVALADADEFRDEYEDTTGEEILALEERGLVKEISNKKGTFKWATWTAPFKAPGLLFNASRYDWIFKKLEPTPATDSEDIPTGEEDEDPGLFSLYTRSKRRGSPLATLAWTRQGALLAVTLFALLLGFLVLDTLTISGTIVLSFVVVVHELGHVLAMRIVKGRDDRVMILPLLARWAGPLRTRIPARKQFLTLLMGPLPGLLAGWVLMAVVVHFPGAPAILKQLAFWLVLYNKLQLLPCLPFDGGRIAKLLVFDRLPVLRLIWFLSTGLAMIGLILGLSFLVNWMVWPLLLIPAATLPVLPDLIRSIRPSRLARKELSSATDETRALQEAARIIEEDKALAKLATGKQIELIDKLVAWTCTKRLGPAGTLCAVAVFLTILASPLWVMLGMAVTESSRIRAEQQLVQSRIAALEAQVNRPLATVTPRTRSQLKTLADEYQLALAHMYAGSGEVEPDPGIIKFDERGIYDPNQALQIVRSLPWDQVASWIAEEDSPTRQQTAKVLIQTLIGDAREQALSGNHRRAMDNLGKAYFGILKCAPRDSLASWIDWLHLEHDLLAMLEEAHAAGHLHPQHAAWFAQALQSRSQPDGRKLAILLLRDLGGATGPASLVDPDAHKTAGILETDRLVVDPDGGISIGEFLANHGFAMRRSQADRNYRRRQTTPAQAPGWDQMLAFTRIARGLPTREEFAAGLTMAEHFAEGQVTDPFLAVSLKLPTQRAIWKARILHIEHMIRYRQLGAVAFHTKSSGWPPETTVSLVGGGSKPYTVLAQARDGTRLRWRMPAGFRPKKPEPPAPTPVTAPVLAKSPAPEETQPATPTPSAGLPDTAPVSVEPRAIDLEEMSRTIETFDLVEEFQRMRTEPTESATFAAPISPE